MTLIADLERSLAEREAAGLLRLRRTVASPPGARVTVDGMRLVNFASNDYLGLANHPQVVAAAREGAARWGAGAGDSGRPIEPPSAIVPARTAGAAGARGGKTPPWVPGPAPASTLSGLRTTKVVPHLGHRILRPDVGTRRSSTW